MNKNSQGGACGSGAIVISSTITSLANDAFRDSSITSVVIPSNIVSIGSNVFYNCSSLSSIRLPISLTSIGSGSFGSASIAPCNNASNVLYVPAGMASSVYSSVKYNCEVAFYGKN